MIRYYEHSSNSFKHQKTDTARIWARYFYQVGFNTRNLDMSRDTSNYVYRSIQDTPASVKTILDDGGTVTQTKWTRDTFYYVPYDSLTKVRDTVKKKDTLLPIRIFLNIPKEWILQDFNREIRPPTAR